MATNTSEVGVILMTYGSPATLDDIPIYLKNIRGGRPADEALIAEFRLLRLGLVSKRRVSVSSSHVPSR